MKVGAVVFHTEAFTGFAANHVLRAAVELLVKAGWDVLVPVVVLAESMTGRPREDVLLHRTLRHLGTVPIDEACARHAGELRAHARGVGASGVGAMVAACATLAGEIEPLSAG